MGVMGCNRFDCDNVLCDRLSHDYGYICDECFDELVSLGVNTRIDFFMDSRKRQKGVKNDPKSFFENEKLQNL